MKIFDKLKELENNNDLILNKDYFNYLKKLKNEISEYETFAKDYKDKNIENYDNYKNAKQDIEKLKDINELFKYIGKKNIDSVIDSMSLNIENNKRFQTREDLNKFGIKKDDLADSLSEILFNYEGKSNYFFENNKVCVWFDKRIDSKSLDKNLKKYNPIIFSDSDYTKIILKEV